MDKKTHNKKKHLLPHSVKLNLQRIEKVSCSGEIDKGNPFAKHEIKQLKMKMKMK